MSNSIGNRPPSFPALRPPQSTTQTPALNSGQNASSPSSSVSTFTATAPPGLTLPPGLNLVPVPVPDVEVPGVGRLTPEQANTLVEAARSAQRQLIQYAQHHRSSVAPDALEKIGQAGALKALEKLGYTIPKDPAVMNEQVGPLLRWALSPFTLSPTPAPSNG